MRIWMQKSASMQKITSPPKFGDLAEKLELNSVSNFSTKEAVAEDDEDNKAAVGVVAAGAIVAALYSTPGIENLPAVAQFLP